MSAEGVITTAEHGGFTVTSNSAGTPEALSESLKIGEPKDPDAKPDLSKAASDLGKKGGEAAAKARRESVKAKPIPDAPKEPAEEPEEAKPEAKAAPEAPEQTEAEKDAEERKSRAQQRVEQATREAAQARREAAELRARLERLEQERTAPAQARDGAGQRPEPRPTQDKPRSEDFENYEDYLDARDQWNREQWTREQKGEQAVQQYTQETIGRFEGFRKKVGAELKANPDLRDTAVPFQDIVSHSSYMVQPGQPHTAFHCVNDELLQSDRPAALMAHLRRNPDVMQSLLRLPDREAITREMAKIEARLDGATSGTPPSTRPASKPEQSKAAPPFQPVKGSPAIAEGSRAPRPGESFDDWYARTQNSKR